MFVLSEPTKFRNYYRHMGSLLIALIVLKKNLYSIMCEILVYLGSLSLVALHQGYVFELGSICDQLPIGLVCS
jgi:hypothetical protein